MKAISLAIVLAACTPAYAQTYKCVDDHGVTHYSDKPPSNCKAAAVKIRQAPGGSAEAPKSPRAAARDRAEANRQCARGMQEYAQLTDRRRQASADDAARQGRVEELREQLRDCS
jgi:hypothetical protein